MTNTHQTNTNRAPRLRTAHSAVMCHAFALLVAFASPQAAAQLVPLSRIDPIVNADTPGGHCARLGAVRALVGKTLTDQEVAALWAFLDQTPTQAELSMGQLSHLRNDILNLLVHHRLPLPNVFARLAAIYYDDSRDLTIRDYCVQFIGQAYPRLHENDRRLARDLLFGAANNHSRPTAGTALIALSDNIRTGIDADEVRSAAVAVAADTEASPGARMTAFSICGKTDATDVLPHARSAARGKTAESINVRVAAVLAIGTLGDDADQELLKPLARSLEMRLRRAAATATHLIQTRSAGPTD